MFRLDGRVAVVTGACGRLGPVWAGTLLQAGARVACIDLEGVAPPIALGELRSRYPRAMKLVAADITQRPALGRALEEIESEFGPVGVLVNNAGVDQPPGPSRTYLAEDMPIEASRRILEVNLLGLLLATQVFLASLRRAGKASVINIGSLYALVSPDERLYSHIAADPPFLKPPMYGASKAGVSSLTRWLATHLAKDSIRVNTLIPGGVAGGQDVDFRRKFSERVPLGRMATGDDLGGPLLFLASDASAYVTGQDLVVDGGFTAW